MSIESLCKVSIVAKQSGKNDLLCDLQNFGALHLVNMNATAQQSSQVQGLSEQTIERYTQAIHYLKSIKHRRKFESLDRSIDLQTLVGDVLSNQTQRHALNDRIDELCAKYDVLSNWGDFTFPDVDALAGQKLWFYLLPNKHKASLAQMTLPYQIVHKDHHRLWVVVINQDEPAINTLPVRRLDIGPDSLALLSKKIVTMELQLEELDAQGRALTRYLSHLEMGKNDALEQSDRLHAKGLSIDLEPLFAVAAWLPLKQKQALIEMSDRLGFAVFFEDPEGDDLPPTLLNNPDSVKGGEVLVGFYQMPAYRGWDPSFMLFSSFSLFFAMILSDAGYALLLASVLAVFAKHLSQKPTAKKLLPLLVCILVCSFVWGVLVGSYFGLKPTNAFLQGLNVFDLSDFDSMMTLSIACGVVHLLLANLYQIKVFWGEYRGYQHIGWILVLAGASGYALATAESEMKLFSTWVLGIGLLSVFIFGSDRSVDRPIDFVLKVLDGLKALTNVTNLFGDVLSYLRLFALGLASASLALTFNQLASNAFYSDSGLGLLFGLLILLVGHTLNLALAIVSGVVHGLRLNYIEFYKWALDGEGYPFKAFKKVGVEK